MIKRIKTESAKVLEELLGKNVTIEVGVFGQEQATKAYLNELVPITKGVNQGVTRPFIEPQAIEQRGNITRDIVKIYKPDKRRKKPMNFELLGTRLAVDMVKYVEKKSNFTPNAPSTIAQKGQNSPLRDTEEMVNAIDYKVVKR